MIPVLPPPTHGFQPFSDKVVVRGPDSTKKEFEGRFQIEHFNFGGGKGKWSITIIIPKASKADVPVGSELMVSEAALATILGEVPR